MPRDIIITVYKYAELDDKAKEKAREWFISCDDGSFDWESLQEDAKNVGIKLHGTHRGSMEGELILDFTQVMAQIIQDHGKECETHKTALEYQEKYAQAPDDEIREELEEEFLKSILEDYRILSEKNDESRLEDKYVEEMIEVNEYEFTKEGKRI